MAIYLKKKMFMVINYDRTKAIFRWKRWIRGTHENSYRDLALVRKWETTRRKEKKALSSAGVESTISEFGQPLPTRSATRPDRSKPWVITVVIAAM